jgi:hypothetical protein
VTISEDIERDLAGTAGGHRVGTLRSVSVLAATVWGVSLGAMHLVVGATLVFGVGRTIEAGRVGA